jgi:hypothetical protein
MLGEHSMDDGPAGAGVCRGPGHAPPLLGDSPAQPSSARNVVVSLERARAAGSDSVNEARGQSRRRLCQISRNRVVPYGR